MCVVACCADSGLALIEEDEKQIDLVFVFGTAI